MKELEPVERLQKKASMPPELRSAEECIGEFIAYWGFRKIHGRIWAHIYTCERPLDTLELMARLRVSKGLMSIAIRELLEHQVIIVDHTGRHGSVFYRANTDLISVITLVLRKRETLMMGKTKSAIEGLINLTPEQKVESALSEARLKDLSQMISSAQILLNSFLHNDTPNRVPEFANLQTGN
jgi:DNA-binding transcriptional regulator GbsR (MarR family)